jgi:hypothetical protein
MQPQWKYLDTIGDRDPITNWGGFVYVDELGNYDPELVWFESDYNGSCYEITNVRISRIILERNSLEEWWYDKLQSVADFSGCPLEELQQMAISNVYLEKALLYAYLLSYFGAYEFDQEPITLTEDEAYRKYSLEITGKEL